MVDFGCTSFDDIKHGEHVFCFRLLSDGLFSFEKVTVNHG